jgi:superoxide reductase
MATLGNELQHADWKKEKHVPVIECPAQVQAGETFDVTITLGKEIAHPNTTEHHISWIAAYFQPADGTATVDLARVGLNAHGQSTQGPNEGTEYTNHEVTISVQVGQPGTLHAISYCNIHGLWEGTQEIDVAS